MRRRALIAVALAVLVLQGPAAAGAAERGAVVGRVVNEPHGGGLARVTVRLVGADRVETRRVTRAVVTDKSGHFRFSRVPAGPRRNYVVATERAGGYFAARSVVVKPGHTAHRVVRTWPTTDRADVVRVRSDNLYLVPSREGVSVVESVTFENNSKAAYIGRAGRMLENAGSAENGPATSLGLALPAAAAGGSVSIVRSDLPLARIRSATFGFGLVNALPPGAHSILYSYNVAGSGGAFVLTRPALYPVERLVVFASAPLEVDGSGLDFGGRTVIRGQTFGKWVRTETFRPLDEVSIAAAARASNAPGLLAGGGLLLALAVASVLALRRRRARARSVSPSPRERLVGAIAELDIRHDAGEIGDQEWAKRRRRLRERIPSRSDKEPVA